MGSRIEAARYLYGRLSLRAFLSALAVRFGATRSAQILLHGGFQFRLSRPGFGLIFDLLHLIDDGWLIQAKNSELVELSSREGNTVIPLRSFLESPWLAVLVASGWKIADGSVTKGAVTFHTSDDLFVIHETFDHHVYAPSLPVRGKIVVDVGASFGDTAVYFAQLGAIVHAFEALPTTCARAMENVENNHCRDSVTLSNIVVSGTPGDDVYVPSERASSRSAGFSTNRGDVESKRSNGRVRVHRRTLSELSSTLDVALLKMDCEGSEYDIILHDYASVRRFQELIIEWHQSITGIPVLRLVKILSKDFDVRVSYGLLGDDNRQQFVRPSTRDVGMIYAVRFS